ncbi:hypothetical protein [Actimicrobium antarcticum]|uniref:Uncharacterized protein n=1 Tax=Actimicrobium antarcticum TaxID=1051899 RepID=A0ABP7T467_9BURK
MKDDFILGDSALHQRLCAITEILGKFVATAPRPLSISQLTESTGRSEKELVKLCAGLARAELLQPHMAQVPGHWALTCAPDLVTLEDVFRCAMAEHPSEQALSTKAPAPSERHTQRLHRDADLLVTQAAMAINQSVFQHLRQFSLDRLNFSTSVPFPSGSASRYSSRRPSLSL